MKHTQLQLLDQALEWAERSSTSQLNFGEPRWNQCYWYDDKYIDADADDPAPVCGTACCIAGYISLISGAEPHPQNKGFYILTPEGQVSTYSDYAASLLGLNDRDQGLLFTANNTLPQLHQMRDNLARERDILDGVYE